MRVLIVDQREVARLLPMAQCLEAMAEALQSLALGEALLPLRQVLRLPGGRGAFALMPAYMESPPAMGAKLITVFPRNEGTAYDSHQGAVVLFEVEHGSPCAVLDASAITAIRTAAVSGVATRLLAREDAGDLAILGSGVQARTHLEAMLLVRRVRRARVWSRTPERARAFAERASRRHGIAVEPTSSAREAASGADIICTVTSSAAPVLLGEWISPGAHVNAVGASVPTSRELDSAAVARARLFADRRESTLHEAGEFLVAKREGAIGDDHIRGEIGELLLGRCAGRESRHDVTLFKSLGLAVEDVAAAHLVYTNAVASGAGTWIELGGARHEGD